MHRRRGEPARAVEPARKAWEMTRDTGAAPEQAEMLRVYLEALGGG